MKPFIYLLAATLLAAPTAFAGTLKVNREFTIARSFDYENYQRKEWDKSEITLTPGVKNFEITTAKSYRAHFCVPPFCGSELGEYIPYMSMTLYGSEKNPEFGIPRVLGRIEIDAKSSSANSSIVYYGRDTGQSFDIYERTADSDRAVNKRTEVRECREQDACYNRELPFLRRRGYDGIYGNGCSYLVGKQQVTLQDRVYTKRTQMKFVGQGGQVLATYKDSSDQTREEILSVGQCRLNRDRR